MELNWDKSMRIVNKIGEIFHLNDSVYYIEYEKYNMNQVNKSLVIHDLAVEFAHNNKEFSDFNAIAYHYIYGWNSGISVAFQESQHETFSSEPKGMKRKRFKIKQKEIQKKVNEIKRLEYFNLSNNGNRIIF